MTVIVRRTLIPLGADHPGMELPSRQQFVAILFVVLMIGSSVAYALTIF